MEKVLSNRKHTLFPFPFVLIVLAFFTTFIHAKQNQVKPLDVLIIYSTGNPYNWKSVLDIAKGIETEIKDIDAITTPTPLKQNCATIAKKLASALSRKSLIVGVAEAMEITHRDEILRARMLVIGSPACFGNVSWKIKKLFDEQFHKIYLLEKHRLANRRIAAFSMAQVNPSARSALQAIKAVVNDCNGRFGPTMIFLTNHSENETERRIAKFADQLAFFVR